MKKVVGYFKEIREMENLELRTGNDWREKGTVEEAAKLAEFRLRKERNNALGVLTGLAITAILIKKERKMD